MPPFPLYSLLQRAYKMDAQLKLGQPSITYAEGYGSKVGVLCVGSGCASMAYSSYPMALVLNR